LSQLADLTAFFAILNSECHAGRPVVEGAARHETDDIIVRVRREGGVVPCHWMLEVVSPAQARAERLTFHDAACLEPAMRRGAVLATLDADPATAASRVDVPPAL
jgi:hypothetical protein